MFKKTLIQCILLFFTTNIFAVNLIIVNGTYQINNRCVDKGILFEEARKDAYSKLAVDKDEYEQVSPWDEQASLDPDCKYNTGYVSASFVKKSEDNNERFVQTKGSFTHGGGNGSDYEWVKAEEDSLNNAKFYCNIDYEPEFIKIVSKDIVIITVGYFGFMVVADYKC